MPAARLVNLIYTHKNNDDKSFQEFLSDQMKAKDNKIKSISVNIGNFSQGLDSLDDVLISSNYALTAFYKGDIGIDITRGYKERQAHVKTVLNKPISLIKVFPYTETQKFYIISPRKIVVHSVLQMEKVFYSDHYYVDIFYNFDE